MDTYKHHNYRRESPSFSSTLLDAIYRSIDEGQNESVVYKETTRNKKQFYTNCIVDDNDLASVKRACMIQKWMDEKDVNDKVESVRRKSVAEFERTVYLNSSTSSSDSSNGSIFSSSEAESAGNRVPSRPKPIRTNSISLDLNRQCVPEVKTKQDRSFASKASKMYSELKKVKQPISPGGKLATFLNSLFNAKKSRDNYDIERLQRKPISGNESSTCSSASSFSRSCLSKTPSSRGKSSNSTKRSVRFYEESKEVKIVRTSINDDLKNHLMEKNRRVEEAARDLLKNYQKQVQSTYNPRNFHEQELEEDNYDDTASNASSDLFELDNLSAIGIGKYCEELPVAVNDSLVVEAFCLTPITPTYCLTCNMLASFTHTDFNTTPDPGGHVRGGCVVLFESETKHTCRLGPFNLQQHPRGSQAGPFPE